MVRTGETQRDGETRRDDKGRRWSERDIDTQRG